MAQNQSNYALDMALREHLLKAMASADLALAHAAVEITEPHTLDAITREWLETTLGPTTPGARIDELTVDSEHDGMTSRKKWLLQWNATGQAANLPKAVFVKATPPTAPHREMLAVLHMDELEAQFYNQVRPEIPELAPQAHYAKSHVGGRSLIMLEDLSLRGCRPYWLADHCDTHHARAVTTALAKLHAKYWQSERLSGDLVWVRPRTQRFGWPWLRQTCHQVRQIYLETAAPEQLPADLADLLRTWNHHSDAIFQYWDSLPATLLHGDTHLGNTYAYADGSAGLFDWQVIFVAGHGLRDLSYFLHSALSNCDRVSHQEALFDLYLEVLSEGGVTLDRAESWNNYCLFTLDFWDANIMTSMQGQYGHASSGLQRNVETIAHSLRDNDVAGRLQHLLKFIT